MYTSHRYSLLILKTSQLINGHSWYIFRCWWCLFMPFFCSEFIGTGMIRIANIDTVISIGWHQRINRIHMNLTICWIAAFYVYSNSFNHVKVINHITKFAKCIGHWFDVSGQTRLFSLQQMLLFCTLAQWEKNRKGRFLLTRNVYKFIAVSCYLFAPEQKLPTNNKRNIQKHIHTERITTISKTPTNTLTLCNTKCEHENKN